MRHDVEADGDQPPETIISYTAPRSAIVRRLALLGATGTVVEHAFAHWLAEERETWRDYAETWSDDIRGRAVQVREGLERLDLGEWGRLAREVLATRYDLDADATADALVGQFRDLNDSYLFFGGYGTLLSLRALLDACPQVTEVTLDVSDLVGSGYYGEDFAICAEARRALPLASDPLAPTVILGEGGTDLLVLRCALVALHPELVDCFSFFDHAEFNVDGGTSYLVKFLKAFAAARLTVRMVAVFDNDTAGVQAEAQARGLGLPVNFVVTRLPDLDLARRYPTVGPSGPVDMDVNGAAAGIELYLGQEALTNEGALRPVRWAGYVAAMDRYQGEVEGKNAVLGRFRQLISEVTHPEEARQRFPELALVWRRIIDLVEASAGDGYLRRHERLIAMEG